MSNPTIQKPSAGETLLFVVLVYVIGMVGGIMLALGLDAIRHFLIWTPYAEFPWQLLRMGVVGGGFVSTLFLVFCLF